VLEPDGKLAAFDPETGKPLPLGEVPAELLARRSEAYLLSDAATTYVVVNSGNGGSHFYQAEIPSAAVDGEVLAFDRASGDLRWRREVPNQRLLVEEFGHSPVLLFAFSDNRPPQKAGRPAWRMDLLALDKRTGEPVLDETCYLNQPPYIRDLTVNPERRSIELGSFNVRLRLQAVPKPPAEAPEAEAAPAG
jgi:outer membrane protein assembly factor BamB